MPTYTATFLFPPHFWYPLCSAVCTCLEFPSPCSCPWGRLTLCVTNRGHSYGLLPGWGRVIYTISGVPCAQGPALVRLSPLVSWISWSCLLPSLRPSERASELPTHTRQSEFSRCLCGRDGTSAISKPPWKYHIYRLSPLFTPSLAAPSLIHGGRSRKHYPRCLHARTD